MHPLYAKADKLSHGVIGAAIEVHRLKGAGLIESIYEKCLARESVLRGLKFVLQKQVLIEYKGATFEEPLRFDMLGLQQVLPSFVLFVTFCKNAFLV